MLLWFLACRLLCGVFLEGCVRVGLEDTGTTRLFGSGRLGRSCAWWLILLVRKSLLAEFARVGWLYKIAPVGRHWDIRVNLGLKGQFFSLFSLLLLGLHLGHIVLIVLILLMIEESLVHLPGVVVISFVQITSTASHQKVGL